MIVIQKNVGLKDRVKKLKEMGVTFDDTEKKFVFDFEHDGAEDIVSLTGNGYQVEAFGKCFYYGYEFSEQVSSIKSTRNTTMPSTTSWICATRNLRRSKKPTRNTSKTMPKRMMIRDSSLISTSPRACTWAKKSKQKVA